MRTLPSPLVLWAALGVLAGAHPGVGDVHASKARVEIAPGELAELEKAKDILIAASDNGREIFVYLPKSSTVRRFTENGQAWGDPISLKKEMLRHRIDFIRMDSSDGRLALLGHTGTAVFSDREGHLLAQHRVFQPSDVAILPGGEYAVALMNVPNPTREGSFLGRRSFGSEVPRLVIYDEDNDIAESGLLEGERKGETGRAVARSLRLSWGGDSLWAGEVGNYRVLELNGDLRLLDHLHDPELDYVSSVLESSPDPEGASDGKRAEGEEEIKEGDGTGFRAPGRDLASQEPRDPPTRLDARYEPVLVDLDWGPKPGRVYGLLDRGGFDGIYQVDQIDPVTGEVRRTAILLPEGFDGVLSQVASGARYLWLRGYSEDSPIFRLDRTLLENGELLDLSMRSKAVASTEPPVAE